MRKRLALTVGAVVCGALGAYLVATRSLPAPVRATAPPKTEAVQPDPEVQVVGKIRARHVIDVAPPTDGLVTAFFAEVGQEVYEGQVLARIQNHGTETARDLLARAVDSATDRVNSIESTMIAARLDASRARAEASRARAEYERLDRAAKRQEMLFKEGATPRITFEKSQSEYELARTQFDALDATARKAEERVEKALRDMDDAKRVLAEKMDELEGMQEELAASEAISPAQGIVIARKGEVGQLTSRSTADFFQIGTQLNELEVLADAPPPVMEQIKPGQSALVMVEGNESFNGTVKGKEGVQAVIQFTNPNPAIRPGLSALVKVKVRP